MLLNLKNLSLLLIIVLGFLIFLTNAIKLGLNKKNFLLSKNITKHQTIVSNKENLEEIKTKKVLEKIQT